MLKEERYDKILEILENDNYVTAQELSKRLYVSLPTIRRDLSELYSRDLLVRTHGGAKKAKAELTVMPLYIRQKVNHSIKRNLCQAAATLLKHDDVIFLDASTTVWQMTDFISPNLNITVVTNSIPLSVQLSRRGLVNFCTGGALRQRSMSYVGIFAQNFTENFNFDKIFFSSYGVNDENIIVDTLLPEVLLRKSVFAQCKEKVFLCDSSKFFLPATYNLINLESVDYLITDKKDLKNKFSKDFAKKIIYV